MSDPDKSLEILITTKADLTGAKAAEAQLEQDIAKARELGETYNDLENRSKKVHGIIAENPASGEAATITSRSAAKVEGPKVPGIETVQSGLESEQRQERAQAEAGGNGPLSWVKAAIEGFRLAFEAMPKIFGSTGSPAAASSEKPENSLVERQARRVAEEAGNGDPALVNRSEAQALLAGAKVTEQIPGGTGQDDSEIAGQAGHAQAIQFAGEKMRAALERNTQVTVSLFNRTLELIDQQNQKLGEVDRKIAEVNGQIKSLKNL